MTEAQLIADCQRNDRRAQKVLYNRYSRAMYSTTFRLLGDTDLAAEALQDGFLLVFTHIGGFEGRSTLGAWIKKIMVRTAIAALRKKRLLTESFNESHDRQALDWGMEAIDAEYLEKAILQLPDGYRAIFLLAEVEGYTHREIAVLLDISEGTSKSQLWNAKKRLRALLAGQTSFQTTGS
jgi:RNA polymerase sigma factor (sigma-70 family)